MYWNARIRTVIPTLEVLGKSGFVHKVAFKYKVSCNMKAIEVALIQ